MAKAGKITEVFDLTAVQKQIKAVNTGLSTVLKSMEKIAAEAGKNKQMFGDAKKISEVDAAQKNLTKTKQAANAHNKELNRLLKEEKTLQAQVSMANSKTAKANTELKIRKQQLNKEAQIEAKTNKNLVGAYQSLNAKLTQAKSKYMDLAAAGKTNTAEAKRLKNEIKKLDGEIQKVKKSTGVFKSGLAGLGNMAKQVGGMMVAAFSIGALKSFFSSALQKWDQQTQAVQKLSAALTANGKDADKLMPRYRRFASSLQRITTVGDEATLAMMQLAETMGVDDLEQAAKDAIGLSKALGLDLNTSMKMVALAAEGEYTMLNRYVPALRQTKDATEQAAIANKLFADGFEIAKKEAEVGLGTVKQFGNAWGDIMETIGGGLAKTFLPLVATLRDAITPAEDLTKTFEQQSDKVINLEDNVKPLVEEYRELEKISVKSADEQDRMNTVIKQLADEVPFAIAQMDEYGNAISINTSMIDDYIEAEKQRLKVMNANEINTVKATQAINEFNIAIQQQQIDAAQGRSAISKEELSEMKVALADMLSARIGYIEQLKVLEGDWLGNRRKINADANKDEINDTKKEAEEKTEIEGDALISWIERRQKYLDAQKAQEEADREEELDSYLDWLDRKEKAQEEATDAEIERDKEAKQRLKEQAIELAEVLIELGNSLFAARLENLEAQQQAEDEQKEHELEMAGDDSAKRAAIEEKFFNKQKERDAENLKIRQKQAKFNKTVGIVDATINTLVGVTKAFSDPGGILGIILGALILATGLATVASIASQPIPAFKEGRKGGAATLGTVGEAGTEAIVTRQGDVSLTPDRPSLAFLPEGASVIPHGELVAMAGRATMTDVPRWSSGDSGFARLENEMMLNRVGIANLTKVVKDKKEAHITMDKRGIRTAMADGANWIEYINNKFSN